MNTRAHTAPSLVPAPGVLFGQYPEQRHRKAPSLFSRLLAWMPATRLQRAPQNFGTGFVASVRDLESRISAESVAQFSERVLQLRARLARDGFASASICAAFAAVAVCCQRTLGIAPYDTQLIAARIMLDGQLAEMATGEGKTLAAALTAATAALAGTPVHVVTANDYLVSRDADALRPLYAALGLTVGAVTQPMTAAARQSAYACNITYCTAKELVFDYLRDGMAAPPRSAIEQRAAALSGAPAPQRLLRGLCMAIIDEADSILIDEARVPLVLSRALTDKSHEGLPQAWQLSAQLAPVVHFASDDSMHSTRLTREGRAQLHARCAQLPPSGFPWLNQRHCDDQVTLALTARHLLQRGRDYVVEMDSAHIVDPATGRKAEGRAWSNGLHQLVEIKEGCTPRAQLETLAQITYQRFFPRYFRLCGMSGTLHEARGELYRIYGLRVAHVPLHRPSQRKQLPAQIFADTSAQWSAVATCVKQLGEHGRPVLVGTDSVRDSEALSRCLTAAGLKHTVLNASQDRDEAAIIAAAGTPGAITVATNMAGRGTDILLDAASREAGGLHVICCQQNASRRIDRQLLGRCARQGDPGSTQCFVALDGPLLTPDGSTGLLKILFKNNMLRNNLKGALVLALLRSRQRAVERRHRAERAALLRQDQQLGDWFAFSGPEQ